MTSCPRALVEARRKCAEVIAAAHAQGWRRIEAHVHERFPRGCRFAERLGFILEGYSPCWLPPDSSGQCAGVFNFARFDPPLPPEAADFFGGAAGVSPAGLSSKPEACEARAAGVLD